MWQKAYVNVLVEHRTDGAIFPRALIWINGREYAIDQILDSAPGYAQKSGGHGIRFTVSIHGKTRYLFREESRWFIEYDGPMS